jgi:Nucleoside 2-deoxyribosyltransferase
MHVLRKNITCLWSQTMNSTPTAYIGSSFRFKKEVMDVTSILNMSGWRVNCRWWQKDFKLIELDGAEWYAMPEIKAIFHRTFMAIREADIMILVTPEETKFNGANVEVGIALALGKPVIAYGKLEKSGMYEPLVKCETLVDLQNVLKEYTR